MRIAIRIMFAHHRYLSLSLLAVVCLLASSSVFAQNTAFTYQGKLSESSSPASGQYDFQFKLYDTQTVGTGAQKGSMVPVSDVTVTNGIFTVQIDFGACASCFDGSVRFLEIAVKQHLGSTFTTLAPRQPITSNPYAIRSLNSGAADGLSVACVNCVTSSQIQSVNGSAVTGTIPVASVPALSPNYIQNGASLQATSNFNISGNGTAGGTLSANIVNTSTQYNIGGTRILSVAGTNNAFVGLGAGNLNTTGQQNSFFGASAGSLNTTGNRNSLFGSQAGVVTTNGANSFFGYKAGFQNGTGGFNSFFGDNAGTQNVDGNNNTAIGYGTKLGSSNLTNATAIGALAQVDASNSLVLGSIAGVNGSTASTNVGIGTTSPSAKLEVSDNTFAALFSTTFGGSNGFIGRSARGTSSSPSATLAGDWLSVFGGRGFSTSVGGFVNGSSAAIIIKATEDFTGFGQGASIIFETSRTGEGASERAERMRIDQNGNVGIGTTSPVLRLDVRDGTGASFNGGHIQIGAPVLGGDEKIIVFGDSGCGAPSFTSPCLYIGEQDVDDRMVLRAGSGGFRFKVGNVEPDSDTQTLGSSSNKWSAVWALNGTIQTSDARLKQGIANLKYGLSQVMQLRPVSFQWKAGNDKSTHLGLIAQEVDAVVPEAVQKGADAAAPLGMNYSDLIPVLIKAIQEQQGTLDRAQAEIKILRAENEALNRRIIAVEAVSTEATSTKKAQLKRQNYVRSCTGAIRMFPVRASLR
ncbi:MAG TPA: tail fiber domain-containing protein [Blastocatellia bacterium]|nr:tail fiber domain-containing protein [Blastocatellia bacterium]